MWQSLFNTIDPATRSAGAAMVCGILTEGLFSRKSELFSEMVGWIMLPILFRIVRRPSVNKLSRATLPSNLEARPASVLSLWIVASCVVTFCIFKTENGIVGFLPALTPLLLVAQEYFDSETRTSAMSHSWFSPFVNTFWGTALAASFAIVTLTNWDLRGQLLSIIPVIAQLVAYIVLTPRTDKSSRFIPPFNIEDAIFPLSLRVVVMLIISLCAETIVFEFPLGQPMATLRLGLVKALCWYCTIQTIQHSSWNIATVMGTFSIMSTRDQFKLNSNVQASSHVISSIIALYQVICMLPKRTKAKSALWILSLVSLAPYLVSIFAIEMARSSLLLHYQEHPVEILIHNANEYFEAMVEKQSKNYATAYNEYRHRYGMEPPPGFEAWFEFAKSHQSPIIDEFDIIYDAISPLLRLSGREVLEIMSDVYHAPNSELWLCAFSGRQAETQCTHPHRTFDRHIQFSFNKLMEDLRGVLPDIKFLINHLDEPRVLIPPRLLEEDPQSNGQFNLSNMSRRPVWDILTKFCSSQESRRSTWTSHTANPLALPFVADPIWAMDLCRHPEYSSLHGLVMSPTSLPLIEGLVPILSTGSPSTMGDILFPSPAYFEPEFLYTDAHDVEWEKKRNNLYWAGSTTGGFALDDQWQNYHRQRFVMLAQNLQRRQHYYLRETSGVVSLVKSSFLNSRLYDVAFTRIFQCERKYCRDQRAYFDVKSWADKDQALRSRLVFDIDGNGISGRYYKLLASRSVPLKQTLLREWHDERLMPWVHYIPVSQSMEELPELVSYLTSTESGQRRAQEIAGQGRDWFSKAFRDVDLTIYTYRLLLELARLQDPERPASLSTRPVEEALA